MPNGNFVGFFHNVKFMNTTLKGPKTKGKKEEITFFSNKEATLTGILTGGGGWKDIVFSSTPLSLVKTLYSIGSWA